METKEQEDADAWRWCMARILVEEGLYHLYTYETEKANPFFMRAMKCRRERRVSVNRHRAGVRDDGREGKED